MNSSALWNILTDVDSRKDSQLNILKNMDDFMLYGKDEAELEQKLEKIISWIEFGGSIITVEKYKMRI